ncbi:hypothetical protein LCGC14_1458010 [marine sediment metagenome]|uniref:Uncharacterized protein n=1 Tax=marine sediment metagenome TaxID=412755 RepID=A0A0F9MHV2_9ZZZZ
MIVKHYVRVAFKKAGKRVPNGFITSLDTFVQAVVDHASANGGISNGDIEALASRSKMPLLGRHVHAAMAQLNPISSGLLLSKAREVKNEE